MCFKVAHHPRNKYIFPTLHMSAEEVHVKILWILLQHIRQETRLTIQVSQTFNTAKSIRYQKRKIYLQAILYVPDDHPC